MKQIFLSVSLLTSAFCFAQSMERQVVASSGGQSNVSGTQIDWTLGEVVVGTATGSGFTVNEGFHQTFIKITSVDEVEKWDLELYPNPTQDFINLNPKSFTEEYKLRLFDSSGKNLLESNNTGPSKVNLEFLPNGVYILQFIANNQIQTYKIIKSK